jgi:predicted O-methyltransferase YrrM
MRVIKKLLNCFFKKKLQNYQNILYKNLNLNRDAGIKKIIDVIQLNSIKYNEVYEHWIIFASLSVLKKNKIKNILEVGTYDAKTTLIISLLFPDAKITTIDLPSSSDTFRYSYGREALVLDFVKKRNNLLSRSKSIDFIEMNSMNLCNFIENTYDLIWIDGAHGYPVVACDIINSYRLLNNNGIAMIDDVWVKTRKNDQIYKSIAAFETLNSLVDAKLIRNYSLLLKRLGFANNIKILGRQKFIGFFQRNKR